MISQILLAKTRIICMGPRGYPLSGLLSLQRVACLGELSAGVVGRARARARVCADSDIVLLLAGPFLKHICIYVSCGLCDSCGCRPWHIELLSISTAAQLL